jgi:hypothetical protein
MDMTPPPGLVEEPTILGWQVRKPASRRLKNGRQAKDIDLSPMFTVETAAKTFCELARKAGHSDAFVATCRGFDRCGIK